MSTEHFPNHERNGGKNETEQRIRSLAETLHNRWRETRWREETQDYEPRIKKTKDENWIEANNGVDEVDIANTPYDKLPSDWQAENRASAEVAIAEVERAVRDNVELDEAFVERASSVLHNKWLERNGSWAPESQNKPYSELTEEEKKKDRDIILEAIKVIQG